jgi:hypothetical protein
MNGWICRFEWLSFYKSAPEFFSTLDPFIHLKMQFKQQKIKILSKFTFLNSDQFLKKKLKVNRLTNAIDADGNAMDPRTKQTIVRTFGRIGFLVYKNLNEV